MRMWQKLCSWAFLILLAGYIGALSCVAVSRLREWAAEYPTPQAEDRIQSQSIMLTSDGWTNVVIEIRWRVKGVSDRKRVNTESVQHWKQVRRN